MRKLLKLAALLLVLIPFTGLSRDVFKGEVRHWSKSDFIGFDQVGDCLANTGDITSIFARFTNQGLVLRLSFDDMVERKSNKVVRDNFSGRNIRVAIHISNEKHKQILVSQTIPVDELSVKSTGYELLRTPESNLLEILFPEISKRSMDDLLFSVSILADDQVADSFFTKVGDAENSGGNCAFVHHGNQGLTYTEVFYGSPWGSSGMAGSGFDEILEVHEATLIPGNFHMSGTLMPAAAWHNPEFNLWLKTMASNGLASMMTSALGQHIMPFMANDMNNWSVHVESQMVQHYYNYIPRIAWVPERVWLAPGQAPDAGVIDWLGDNWTQHGVWGVVLDDWPHLGGYDNSKIHWMNNGSGVNLRVIPINNSFVGNMMYNVTAAKNQITSTGQYGICVYGTDWEVAAEMNEHDGTFFLDNYENVMWYCHDNYPAVNVWKLEDAIMNPDFNGTGAELTTGTYGLLGGTGGYGGSNNSWYTNWAATPSLSDFHDPKRNYGTVWWDAYNFLMGVNDNTLSQLGWYTLMINLHETGWHTDGQVADWEHRYSSHIKNANAYTEASRWADGQYTVTTACYFDDIDRDGIDELVIHNDKIFMVFESIGGKANWVFYKNGFGDAFSVVSSDMAYWVETTGDYNESSNNHVAALSDVWPNQQHSIYNINIIQPFGDTVIASLDQWGIQKTIKLHTGSDFLDVTYNFYGQTGYVKSGWSPDLLDLLWSGQSNLERVWGENGSYCGYRNSSSGATSALVLGNGGAYHNLEFEGTLVRGDEISGHDQFKMQLYAGYTSPLTGTKAPELEFLAGQNLDVFPPQILGPAVLVSDNALVLSFTEAVDDITAENISNYNFQDFLNTYTIVSAQRQWDWNKVKLTIAGNFVQGDQGNVVINNVTDLNGNVVPANTSVALHIPTGITPHTIVIDGISDFIQETELMDNLPESLYITWDHDNLYLGFYSLNLDGGGDLFINIDTDQTPGNGAMTCSWGRVDFANPYLPEFQVAIEGGGGSMQVNQWTGSNWVYPGNGVVGSSYEGWGGNGLTEISIPWVHMGNPTGIALSVHVTEEDNHMVQSAYPVLNPTGNHPLISFFYAFFQPFSNGAMPLSGMQPNNAYVVPNTPPVITGFSPTEMNISVISGDHQIFSVVALDGQNDQIYYTWKLDGAVVGDQDNFIYEPFAPDVGNHLLMSIVSDNIPGNDPDTVLWNIAVSEPNIVLNLKVYLEGPFEDSAMGTFLNTSGILPLSQPYQASPWNYNGSETVLSIPGITVVDWVLVELRDAQAVSQAAGESAVARMAAFVTSDGIVRSISGNQQLTFPVAINDSLYVVIWHRNHLGVMSSQGLVQTEGVYNWDFTTSYVQTYGGGAGIQEIGPGIWGMAGGDASADGLIDHQDKFVWWEANAGEVKYHPADLNLDTQINNQDKNEVWLLNIGKGSQVSNSMEKNNKTQEPK